MQKILILTIVLVQSGLCFSKDQLYKFDNVTITAGNWLENYQSVQTNATGGTEGFDIAPYFSTSIDYFFHDKWTIIPEVGWVVQREAADSRISKNLFFTRFDFAYWLQDNLRLRLGSSLMILTMSGNGGEKTLPSGDSDETYYIPTERRTALNQTLDFGAEYIIDRISLRAQGYIYAWLDSDERVITYSTSISYLIPIKELM